MGRRRNQKRLRADCDVESTTIEEIYDRQRRRKETVSCSFQEPDSDDPEFPLSNSTHKPKKQKQPADKSQDDRIESLRKKKQERKLRQTEKKAEKEKQTEALRESQKSKTLAVQQKEGKKGAENSGFTTIRKGVQYQDVVIGSGPIVRDRKKVRVTYTLRAKHRFGKILDASHDFGFRLGRGEVIEGWDLGLQGMRQGGKRFIVVPPEAGYGNQNIGGGPGATLFFEVTVLVC